MAVEVLRLQALVLVKLNMYGKPNAQSRVRLTGLPCY